MARKIANQILCEKCKLEVSVPPTHPLGHGLALGLPLVDDAELGGGGICSSQLLEVGTGSVFICRMRNKTKCVLVREILRQGGGWWVCLW